MSVEVRLAESEAERLASWRIRERVFIAEQGIDESIERDELDALSWHFVAWLDGAAVGTARVFGLDAEHRPVSPASARTMKIGRMAVLPERRGAGLGRRLLDAAIAHAVAHGVERAELSAQSYVASFYARAGFVADGDEYLEAGIPHRHMTRRL